MTATFPTAPSQSLSAGAIAPKSPSFKPAPVQAHPKKVIAIGDSLVYGYGDGEGGGWVERLRLQWMNPETPGPVLYNLGVRGDGVTQVAKRLESEFCDRGELRHRTPDVLILSFGVNDSACAGRVNGRPVTDIDNFERQMAELLVRAGKLCPVYFVGMVPVNEAAMPFANILHFSHERQQQYRDVTRHLCEMQQIPYLDLFEEWRAQGEEWVNARLCADGIHPNVLGYRTILEAV
ncbi:MAG: GDSL-type esterase/lipase family protein, partial [Cyanobacteria bacterium J06632_3]